MTSQNDRKARPGRRWASRLLLAAGGVTVALAIGEAVARVAVPAYGPRRGTPEIVSGGDDGPLFRLEPQQEFEHVWDGDPLDALPPGARLTYRIDAHGYRSGRASGAPVDVLVLGDSFTFGEGVALEDRFTERLGARFGQAGRAARVYNAAVPGYSTVDEWFVLREQVARLRPRAVLVIAQPNDAVPITHAQGRAAGDMLAIGGLRSRFRLLDAALSRRRAAENEAWYLSYWTGENASYSAEVFRALELMRDAARASGATLGVAAFPLLHRLDDYPLEPVHRRLGGACRDRGIAFVDLLPAFVGKDARRLWVHPSDHHPNARAHAIAAERLAPFVTDLLR